MDWNRNHTGSLSGDAYFGGVYQLVPPRQAGHAYTRTVIFAFPPTQSGYAFGYYGADPVGNLLIDSAVALYGVTRAQSGDGEGTVYQLGPPSVAGGACSIAAPHIFFYHIYATDRDGAFPGAGLIADRSGNLCGTTAAGGGNNLGTVYRLSPPVAGQTSWAETVLYSFEGGNDGAGPLSQLVADRSGDLFGQTSQGGGSGCTGHECGTKFQLVPIQGGTNVVKKVLYAFPAGTGTLAGSEGGTPLTGLTVDRVGVLFGTNSAGGVTAGVCAQKSGCGTVFSLAPPPVGQTGWTESTRYSFSGLDGFARAAAVVRAPSGQLFVTTMYGGPPNSYTSGLGCGVVFSLIPPVAGAGRWIEHSGGSAGDPCELGAGMQAGLLMVPGGLLYGTAGYGGPTFYGTAFVVDTQASDTKRPRQ